MEGLEKPLASPEEELQYLRAQVEAKERELSALKQERPRGEIIHERIIHHRKTPAEETLAPSYQLAEPEAQALAFMGGANSIFAGDKLLTTPNPKWLEDSQLFSRLGLLEMPRP